MTENERIKIQKRIEFKEREIEHGKVLKNQAEYGRFWDGRLAAIDGTDGELAFLKALLKGDEEYENGLVEKS